MNRKILLTKLKRIFKHAKQLMKFSNLMRCLLNLRQRKAKIVNPLNPSLKESFLNTSKEMKMIKVKIEFVLELKQVKVQDLVALNSYHWAVKHQESILKANLKRKEANHVKSNSKRIRCKLKQ